MKTVEKYLEQLNVSDSTKKKYGYQINSWIEYLVCNATKEQATNFIEGNEEISPSGKRVKLAALNGFSEYCMDEGIAKANPFKRIRYEASEYDPVHVPSRDEIKTFIEFIEKQKGVSDHQEAYMCKTAARDLAIVHLLISSGMRSQEMANINVGDINLNICSVRIIRKGGKPDTAYFSAQTARKIKAYMHSPLFRIHGSYSKESPLFLSLQGKRMCLRAIENMFQRYSEYSGVEIKPHTCRKIYATNAYYVTNGDILKVTDLLGNKDVAVTANHYIMHKTLDANDISESIGF